MKSKKRKFVITLETSCTRRAAVLRLLCIFASRQPDDIRLTGIKNYRRK